MHLHAFTYVKFDGILFLNVILTVSGDCHLIFIINPHHASGYVNLFLQKIKYIYCVVICGVDFDIREFPLQ